MAAAVTGWLEKKGHNSFLVDSWERRFFIFDPRARTIQYGASEAEARTKPRGVATLGAVRDVADRGGKRANRVDFEAQSPQKGRFTLAVAAASLQEKQRWLAATAGGAQRTPSGLGLLQAAMPLAATAPPPMAAPMATPMAAAPRFVQPPAPQQLQYAQFDPSTGQPLNAAAAPQIVYQQAPPPPPQVVYQQPQPTVIVAGGGYNPYGGGVGNRMIRREIRRENRQIRRENRAMVGAAVATGAVIGGILGGGGHHHHHHGRHHHHHHHHRGF